MRHLLSPMLILGKDCKTPHPQTGRNIGIPSRAAGNVIFCGTLLEGAGKAGWAAIQRSFVRASLAGIVILCAVEQAVIRRINRSKIAASLIIAGLTFASGIKVLPVKCALSANADLLLPGIASFIIRGAKTFGVIIIRGCRAVVDQRIGAVFAAEIMRGGAVRTAVRIESGVAGTFIFAATGIRTERFWVKTFAALKTVISVAASVGKGNIIRAKLCGDVIAGTRRHGRFEAGGIAFGDIIKIIRLANVIKADFVGLIDNKMHFREFERMGKDRPGWKQPGERRLN